MKLRFYLFSMLLFIAISCTNSSPTKEEVASIPDAGPPKCSHADAEAYNLSLGDYSSRKGLTYYVANKPAYMDSAKANDIIDRAWDAWKEHIQTPFIKRVFQPDGADLVIRFQKLDGKGGVLGQAEFPPTDSNDFRPRGLIFDDYDLASASGEGKATFDFFTTAVHECGHSLGLKHCDDRDAVMFYLYTGPKHNLRMDDVAGIRERYAANDFIWNDRCYKYIFSDRPGKATKNFAYQEYYTKCNYSTGHYLDSALFIGLQTIRSYYQIPIKIISTYRTHECNSQAGGASRSQHMQYNAVDWKFTGKYATTIHHRYQEDIKNRGVVFQLLFTNGIRGFGTYATSNHIDTRKNSNMLVWMGQFYNVWGKSNEAAFLAPDYFGIEDCEN